MRTVIMKSCSLFCVIFIFHFFVLVLPEFHYQKKEENRPVEKRKNDISTPQILEPIVLGIKFEVNGYASNIKRNLLTEDFKHTVTATFSADISKQTPEFTFKSYAPLAFQYIRDIYGVRNEDFLMSMSSSPLKPMPNPAKSGSLLFLTYDYKFFIKTLLPTEVKTVQKLLPLYYKHITQNPWFFAKTLLPKFFGLYSYKSKLKSIRVVLMNNILPSSVPIHQKFDLKGSTHGRKASKLEKSKKTPTYKDVDFIKDYPQGIFLEADDYLALIKTIEMDSKFLESYNRVDYSLLIGIRNLDQEQIGRAANYADAGGEKGVHHERPTNSRWPVGIPAKNAKGEKLLLYMGIVDIFKAYGTKEKLAHSLYYTMIGAGATHSVINARDYSRRFIDFFKNSVFKMSPHK